MVGIVERLVPNELWELFQRVVPEAPSRPQGGGRRRHGDQEVLAAIVFGPRQAAPGSSCPLQRPRLPLFGKCAHRLAHCYLLFAIWAVPRECTESRGSVLGAGTHAGESWAAPLCGQRSEGVARAASSPGFPSCLRR